MKCIKRTDTGEILRVTDEEAVEVTKHHYSVWKYCPKCEWKRQQKEKSDV